MNWRSLAIETSPGEVKLAGREVSKATSETEKREEAESRMLNNLPVVVPLAPMLRANRSPVAVVAEPGVQSRFINEPVPAAPVKAVEVVLMSDNVPDVNVFPVVAI